MGASMWRLAFIAFALLSFGAAGCTGRDGVHDAGDSARGMVKVDLSYTHTVGQPAADVQFDAQARFVRYRAFDPASVPTILGFADFDAVPLDSCKVSDGTAELDDALASAFSRADIFTVLNAGSGVFDDEPGTGPRQLTEPISGG